MEIRISDNVGFCYGVNRAFNNTIKLNDKKNIYMYGQLVHNNSVIEKITNTGIKIFENIDNLPENSYKSTVIIRAHGITSKEREILEKNFKQVIDMTCPIVTNLIKLSKGIQEKGYYIVVYGKESHPEMRGLKGNLSEDKILITKEPLKLQNKSKVCIISQTTVDYPSFKKFYLKMLEINQFSDIIIKNTICRETYMREQQALEISQWADKVFVIGGKNSSNTTKLYKISKMNCKNSYHIESIEEIKEVVINKEDKIGILTGASTPLWQLENIKKHIEGNIS
ncbi:4-hydroxy-3-methylbut-2-enyl diphosphate reductase [Oceanotoga teriensis]|jgi:4-hydroxy-3-methylbut-2-enyl diphosphate reductase|uniref:4-hydroxy-3-methylbut-2-enyl diphosphate reductase n=1 Tax=Oceanotoga teriensis TaxID=515440 RepID=A0AA45HI86_9BACT|nr:4-hydroxy-3-methylbut-2-enyl diphosphate reductase [Oceanotoga teriensis]MDO7977434.1 4-hydroxy-3-methylbut-2-enyl diphosphate reductase [Oceanotoga teriensis]PWJ89614.1 4-hydroxy-3-methylbut-2-enyl diphosphate reductase [Oceanotoga teriensis]